jgi:hypothetical protein
VLGLGGVGLFGDGGEDFRRLRDHRHRYQRVKFPLAMEVGCADDLRVGSKLVER